MPLLLLMMKKGSEIFFTAPLQTLEIDEDKWLCRVKVSTLAKLYNF